MITVLRLGHRIGRDARTTTHCALVARAFGAKKIIYSGEKDSGLENSIKNIVVQWGGPFDIEYNNQWKKVIKEFIGIKIHLTAYGESVQNKINEIRKKTRKKNILLIVGGKKVLPEVYDFSNYNIAITSQPHSEVSSICLFLDYYFKRKELNKKFLNGKIKILPSKNHKKIMKL